MSRSCAALFFHGITTMLLESLIDALRDSATMLPLLFVIYLVAEWIDLRYGDVFEHKAMESGKAAPAVASVLGLIPQCGFSVVGSALYARRAVTAGTLIAVFLATSDEAVPIILSQPRRAGLLIPLLCTKLVIALIGGYGIDFLWRRPVGNHDEEPMVERHTCCSGVGHSPWRRALHHTTRVFLFVALVSFALNLVIAWAGPGGLGRVLDVRSPLQPVITAFVGLIPNCASSVALTQAYLAGGISFGAAISGLCAAGGLGILVLVRDNPDRRDTLRVLVLLLLVSITAGVLIHIFVG